jgi:hypothetical protein
MSAAVVERPTPLPLRAAGIPAEAKAEDRWMPWRK